MLKLLAKACRPCDVDDCPSIYQDTETGDWYVQGYLTDGSETRVRIPAEAFPMLLAQLAEAQPDLISRLTAAQPQPLAELAR